MLSFKEKENIKTGKIVKTIVDKKIGRKWEIYEKDGKYAYLYYEYFTRTGWEFITGEDFCGKDFMEWHFKIEL